MVYIYSLWRSIHNLSGPGRDCAWNPNPGSWQTDLHEMPWGAMTLKGRLRPAKDTSASMLMGCCFQAKCPSQRWTIVRCRLHYMYNIYFFTMLYNYLWFDGGQGKIPFQSSRAHWLKKSRRVKINLHKAFLRNTVPGTLWAYVVIPLRPFLEPITCTLPNPQGWTEASISAFNGCSTGNGLVVKWKVWTS